MYASKTKLHMDVLRRVKRGLAGYVSYLAACEMNSAFSEYVLYEPILRILTAQGYQASCEVVCPGFPDNTPGDKKRIDFEAQNRRQGTFVMEVKWAKRASIKVSGDHEKLVKYREANPEASCFLCVFGRKSHIQALKLDVDGFRECGQPVVAEFGQTRFGCRVYTLK